MFNNFLKRSVFVAALMFGFHAAYADSFEVNGIIYNPISDTEAEVTQGNSFGIEYTGEIVIPEQVSHEGITYNVVAVGEYAFGYCSDLTSVVIPESVIIIRNGAFFDCKNLSSVVIPESVTIIGIQAFYHCENLSSVVVPKSVKKIGDDAFEDTAFYANLPYGEVYLGSVLYSYKIDHNSYDNPGNTRVEVKEGTTYISPYAFERVHHVTSIIIPETVTEIGDYAFSGSGLTELSISDSVTIVGESAIYDTPYYENLPDGVIYLGGALYGYKGNMPENTSIAVKDGTKSISNEAFQSQINLISVTLPEGIAYIGSVAFYECENLTTINIPDGVTFIGGAAFRDCKSLTSINIPDGVTSIYGGAFSGCKSLTSINIPDGVTSIGGAAFRDCKSLTSINIPDGVTSIEMTTFFGCTSLTSINIPDGVTSIGEAAFACTGLQHIYSLNEEPANCSEYAFFEVPVETCVLHVPTGCVDAYKAADCWKNFVNIVGDQAGIKEVESSESAETEYFDLHGRKVTAPQNGIFIKKQGKNTSKVLL